MFTNTMTSLCNSHDTVMYWNKEAKRALKAYIKSHPDSEDFLNIVLDCANKSIEETRIAKKKGQRMESRLKSYRSSIEKLGFQRI